MKFLAQALIEDLFRRGDRADRVETELETLDLARKKFLQVLIRDWQNFIDVLKTRPLIVSQVVLDDLAVFVSPFRFWRHSAKPSEDDPVVGVCRVNERASRFQRHRVKKLSIFRKINAQKCLGHNLGDPYLKT